MSKYLNVLREAAQKRLEKDAAWISSTWAKIDLATQQRKKLQALTWEHGGGTGKWRGCPA
jgi:hypothetical protein